MSGKHPVVLYGVAVAATMAGAMLGTRWRRVEVRRAELNREYAHTMEKMRLLQDELLLEANTLTDTTRHTHALEHTVDTLWQDRLRRYGQTNADLHAYTRALPEALGALHGLTRHYDHVVHEVRPLIGFDVGCFKLHNLALLLAQATVTRMAPVLRQLFAAEPLVQSVCASVEPTAALACPTSPHECGDTLAVCVASLQKSVAVALAESREGDTTAASSLETNTATSVTTSGVWSEVVGEVVRAVRAQTTTPTAAREAELQGLLARETYRLHTLDDVRAAFDYADRLLRPFQPSDGARDMAAEREWDAVVRHTRVRQAVCTLQLWQRAVGVFLAREQALEALQCYHALLAITMAHVHPTAA